MDIISIFFLKGDSKRESYIAQCGLLCVNPVTFSHIPDGLTIALGRGPKSLNHKQCHPIFHQYMICHFPTQGPIERVSITGPGANDSAATETSLAGFKVLRGRKKGKSTHQHGLSISTFVC